MKSKGRQCAISHEGIVVQYYNQPFIGSLTLIPIGALVIVYKQYLCPGTEETVRVVAMEKDFHVDCYVCEVNQSDLVEPKTTGQSKLNSRNIYERTKGQISACVILELWYGVEDLELAYELVECHF